MFYKKGALKNFAIFIGKQMCWNLSLKKVCEFIKKRVKHRFFLMNVTEFVRTDFFTEHLWRLFSSFYVTLSFYEEESVTT